jgi:pimeloyl-ACP methyl ester carboxylesterase
MHSSIRLADQRALAYEEFGDPGGRPVVYFHGTPGSRQEVSLLAEDAKRVGVRLIAVDRPGYGRSDFQPDRALLDWPRDATALVDHLRLEQFSILGISGGVPYALACAHAMPSRLRAVAIVCGLAPIADPRLLQSMNPLARAGVSMGARWPLLHRVFFGGLVAGTLRRFPEMAFQVLGAGQSRADRETVRDPRIRAVLVESVREALRQGGRGAAWDLVLYSRPWGFALEDVRVPVHLWHGEDDRTVPPEFGRFLAARLPDCRAEFLPGEGHFSLPFKLGERILRAL